MSLKILKRYRDLSGLTVDFSDDVKLGDTEKNIIALKVRGGHGV